MGADHRAADRDWRASVGELRLLFLAIGGGSRYFDLPTVARRGGTDSSASVGETNAPISG